jgi:hypothetical protein
MTMALVRAAAAALPVDHLEIIGPYVTDQIHQTDGAKMIMAMEILSISGGAP